MDIIILSGVRGFLTRKRLQESNRLDSTLDSVPSIPESVTVSYIYISSICLNIFKIYLHSNIFVLFRKSHESLILNLYQKQSLTHRLNRQMHYHQRPHQRT